MARPPKVPRNLSKDANTVITVMRGVEADTTIDIPTKNTIVDALSKAIAAMLGARKANKVQAERYHYGKSLCCARPSVVVVH